MSATLYIDDWQLTFEEAAPAFELLRIITEVIKAGGVERFTATTNGFRPGTDELIPRTTSVLVTPASHVHLQADGDVDISFTGEGLRAIAAKYGVTVINESGMY